MLGCRGHAACHAVAAHHASADTAAWRCAPASVVAAPMRWTCGGVQPWLRPQRVMVAHGVAMSGRPPPNRCCSMHPGGPLLPWQDTCRMGAKHAKVPGLLHRPLFSIVCLSHHPTYIQHHDGGRSGIGQQLPRKHRRGAAVAPGGRPHQVGQAVQGRRLLLHGGLGRGSAGRECGGRRAGSGGGGAWGWPGGLAALAATGAFSSKLPRAAATAQGRRARPTRVNRAGRAWQALRPLREMCRGDRKLLDAETGARAAPMRSCHMCVSCCAWSRGLRNSAAARTPTLRVQPSPALEHRLLHGATARGAPGRWRRCPSVLRLWVASVRSAPPPGGRGRLECRTALHRLCRGCRRARPSGRSG